MKFLALISLLTFSLSSFASDLSFGSFEVEEKAQVPTEQTTDLNFASFESTDSQSRSIASESVESTPSVDPIAFGSFE